MPDNPVKTVDYPTLIFPCTSSTPLAPIILISRQLLSTCHCITKTIFLILINKPRILTIDISLQQLQNLFHQLSTPTNDKEKPFELSKQDFCNPQLIMNTTMLKNSQDIQFSDFL
jgi:hypothetical protein